MFDVHVVGTEATNVVALQEDHSAMSIRVMWDLPSSPPPVGSGFVVLYETRDSSNSVSVDFCTECDATLPELMNGATYSIYVITESAHLPSRVGPVNVTLGQSR